MNDTEGVLLTMSVCKAKNYGQHLETYRSSDIWIRNQSIKASL